MKTNGILFAYVNSPALYSMLSYIKTEDQVLYSGESEYIPGHPYYTIWRGIQLPDAPQVAAARIKAYLEACTMCGKRPMGFAAVGLGIEEHESHDEIVLQKAFLTLGAIGSGIDPINLETQLHLEFPDYCDNKSFSHHKVTLCHVKKGKGKIYLPLLQGAFKPEAYEFEIFVLSFGSDRVLRYKMNQYL